MPTYTFKNRKTGKKKEYTMSIKDYDKFKEDHPELERIIDNTAVVFNSLGINTVTQLAAKKDARWREVLAKIGEQNPHSELNRQYSRNKSIKRIKAEEVVEKHAKIQAKQRDAYAKRK